MTVNETTPLTAAAASSYSVIDQMNRVWNTIATNENKKAAHHIIQNLQRSASQGSIRFLAVVSAICLVFSSSFGILNQIVHFHLFAAILHCYTFVLGCVLLLLESLGHMRRQQQSEPLSLMETIYESIICWAPFLTYVWGRGALYVVAGSLHMVYGSFSEFFVGGLTVSVGALYIVVERQIIARLRTSFAEHNWRTKFEQADHDGDGKLSIKDFKDLMNSLGLQLSLWELEVAFLSIDPRDIGFIKLEEIQHWWSGRVEGN
jgi:hypothetical protein